MPGLAVVLQTSRLCPVVQPFSHRLRYSKNAVSSAPGLLPDPFGDTRLVFDDLAHEFNRESPHLRQFVDREVPLFERLQLRILHLAMRTREGVHNLLNVSWAVIPYRSAATDPSVPASGAIKHL